MNLMQKNAEMLGVKLNEEFLVVYGNGEKSDMVYRLTENGLEYNGGCNTPWHLDDGCQLINLLTGTTRVERIEWLPGKSEMYYYVNQDGFSCECEWSGWIFDTLMYRIGNFYKTRSAADRDANKWRVFFKSIEPISWEGKE